MERIKVNRTKSHPGEILKELYIDETEGLSQKKLAESIGVSFRTVNQICNMRRGITPEVAVRLAKYFSTSPELWLNLQMSYDLQKAQRSVDTSHIKPAAV
ncbi:HigA family addiction module antitoxin [Limisalsivibrio acetivorans]|uniref:HigA family addiction module antitoxin n=1 Tax=Limisalsivibrio acetivorans TaxID=1304888 RepID=UPI0003B529E1|nr:HigA family addiction module antitoxin [Limisalsivibrio acetivorans]